MHFFMRDDDNLQGHRPTTDLLVVVPSGDLPGLKDCAGTGLDPSGCSVTDRSLANGFHKLNASWSPLIFFHPAHPL